MLQVEYDYITEGNEVHIEWYMASLMPVDIQLVQLQMSLRGFDPADYDIQNLKIQTDEYGTHSATWVTPVIEDSEEPIAIDRMWG